MEDGEISNDDPVKEGSNETWFGLGMIRKEKIEARHPWRNSLIIKLVRQRIGYHFLCRHIHMMWRTQLETFLIDLQNDFFIVKLFRREEYVCLLSKGPWMIGDNYLHRQHREQTSQWRQWISHRYQFGFIFHLFQLSTIVRDG